ncbi:DUF5994 family protein [Sciscionella marina]|uniref:DUF5994 family protein n=1 Tax=Sciscionella marina TaxID=508770 RepID=UPI0012F631ED|nr:DUF5994 family protein [Sciscionella marina]
MKSTLHSPATMAPVEPAKNETHDRSRLRLKPHGPPAGYVDGAWWPRSRDLTREIPRLAAMLASSWLPPSRITFAMEAWDPAPRRVSVNGRLIRLGGFHSQDEHLLDVLGPDGERLTLLVVPPENSVDESEQALQSAADPDNRESPEDLLSHGTALSALPRSATADDSTVDAWESEGGQVHDSRRPTHSAGSRAWKRS